MTTIALPLPASFLARIAAARQLLARVPMAVLELMFRISVGAVFFKSGLVKIASWDTTVQLFADEYRVPLLPPDIAATLGAFNELTMPVLIVLGFGARFGAAALLFMTLVIQTFVYPENWPEHLMWASLFGYIVTRGAGPISLDHLIARAFGLETRR